MRKATLFLLAAFACLVYPTHTAAAWWQGVYVGISTAKLHDSHGPFSFDLLDEDRFEVPDPVAHGPEFGRNVHPLALEAHLPLYRGLGLDIGYFLTSSSPFRGGGNWFFTPPPPAPSTSSLPVDVRTRTRAALVALSYNHALTPELLVYGKIGAVRTQNEVIIEEFPAGLGGFREEFRESDTRTWVGVGARYRVYTGLTLNAEYGEAEGGFRSSRVGVGWTF